jgi:dolichol-phosphate mannosyltransferase
LVEGDGTYAPADVATLLGPIESGRAEHVIGDRFADMRSGAMSRLNRVGNRLINGAFRYVHGHDFGDILSGYRAFTLESIESFRLTATGFGIETELAVECAKHEVPTAVVPITYRPRPQGSATNLRPFRDGAAILVTLYRLAKTNNPLFYFGSIGAVSVLFGTVLAAYVGYEWFVYDVSHAVMAVVAGVAVLFGVQLVMFGVLSDMILALHREQLRRLE